MPPSGLHRTSWIDNRVLFKRLDLPVVDLNVAGQYMKWLKPGEVERIEDIIPGQGAIVSKGTTKLAVYREPSGESHIRSAVCPHLKCIVGWNSEEQSWDCPCHGSRFDRYGKVLNGPANTDLSQAA